MKDSNGKLRKPRYAHAEGITDICYSNDGSFIITGGADGEIRIFENLDDNDCKSFTLADEIYCIAYEKNGNILIGSEMNMVQSFTTDEGKPNGIITRFTSYPTDIQVSKDKNIIAVGSSDMTIKVHNVSKYQDLLFSGHEAPVLSVALDPKEDFLASSSCDGTVRIWNFHTQTVVRSFPIVPKSNSFTTSITLCRLKFTNDGEHLLIPNNNKLQVYMRSNWKLDFELTDLSISNMISVVCISPCGTYVACGCTDGRILIWNLTNRNLIANDKLENNKAITGLVFNPNGKDELAYVNFDGRMGTMENFLMGKLGIGISNTALSKRDGECNEEIESNENDIDDNEISLADIKNSMGFADDEEGTFIGYQPTENVNCPISSRLETPTPSTENTIQQPRYPEIQKPFQNGMSPLHIDDRYMLWNNIGIVRQYRNEEENSIEVEFHDSQVHHPIHFNNSGIQSYTKAALNEQAFVLVAECQDYMPCKMIVQHFAAWDGSKEWQTTFPDDEDVLAICIDKDWLALATNKLNLRIFSLSGMQLDVYCIPGPIVCLNAFHNQLMIIYHSGTGVLGQQCMSCTIINVKGGKSLIQTPVNVPLTPNSFLSWAGFTDEGTPLIVDSAGLVKMFSSKFGSLWNVLLNSKNYAKGKSDHYFIIGINELQGVIKCIFCKGSRYPPVIPKPHVTVLEFKTPLCEPEEQKSSLEASLIQSKLLLETVNRIGGQFLDENIMALNRKLKESMLELFALACQSDKESRAIDICESMSSLELIEVAFKFATKTHRMQLAERLSSVVQRKNKELFEKDFQSQSEVSDSMTEEFEHMPQKAKEVTIKNSNPLLSSLQKRPLVGKCLQSVSEQINPFRKSSSCVGVSDKGFAALDTLKVTKTKQSSVLQPLLKKQKILTPKVSSSDSTNKNFDDDSKLTNIENNKSLGNLLDSKAKKTSALKLWLEDNCKIVLDKYPECKEADMIIKAALIFKDVETSVKQSYKSMALAKNEEVSCGEKTDRKRVTEMDTDNQPEEKKLKTNTSSKLATFAFTNK